MPRNKPRQKRRSIHDNIKTLRTKLNLTQEDLADIVGVDKSSVHYWECGRSSPTGRRLPSVAKALGVTLDQLFAEAA